MADGVALQAAAQDTLADAIRVHADGAMLTGFVAICEVIDPDGTRAVWTLTTPDAQKWQTLGFLHYALAVEQAGTVADRLDDGDDGDDD